MSPPSTTAPPLEWSSDSSEDSYACEEPDENHQPQQQYDGDEVANEINLVSHGHRNLIDMAAEEDGDNCDDSLSPRPDANALLRTVASVKLPARSLQYDAEYGEARTSVSSPGRRMTLRERLRARVKLQQRIRLARAGNAHDLEDSDVAPEDEEEDHYQRHAPALPEYPLDRYNSRSSKSQRGKGKGDTSNEAIRVQIVPTAVHRFEPTTSGKTKTNRILLHVYDLIEKDTLMMLPPFGCVVEIGKCFADMNSALHAVGTGAYHVGVEINGVEYAYGATSVTNQTGVFTCFPRLSPGYQYRTTIDLGERPLVRRTWVSVPADNDTQTTVYRQVQEFVEGRTVMKEMAPEYMGSDYDILRKNCCTFARDACLRLGVPDEEIPTWFRNLAESGALTQDAVRATVEPLSSVLSLACDDTTSRYLEAARNSPDQGIEAIFQTSDQSRVVVVDSHHGSRDLRRNSTWTY